MSIDNIVSIYRLATPEEKRDGGMVCKGIG